MSEFLKELGQLPEERQKAIRKGLQNQITAQADFIRDEQPTKFLAYIDEEIEKADASMLKMVQESSREGAELGAISEIYIWNKERKKALAELRDGYLQQNSQSLNPEKAAPEPQQMPPELDNKNAKRYFDKAIELGLMDRNYKWLKGLQMLACFANEMSKRLKLGKGANSDGRPRISWQPFEILFSVDRGKLRLNYNDIQKTGQQPKESCLIDKVFE